MVILISTKFGWEIGLFPTKYKNKIKKERNKFPPNDWAQLTSKAKEAATLRKGGRDGTIVCQNQNPPRCPFCSLQFKPSVLLHFTPPSHLRFGS